MVAAAPSMADAADPRRCDANVNRDPDSEKDEDAAPTIMDALFDGERNDQRRKLGPAMLPSQGKRFSNETIVLR